MSLNFRTSLTILVLAPFVLLAVANGLEERQLPASAAAAGNSQGLIAAILARNLTAACDWVTSQLPVENITCSCGVSIPRRSVTFECTGANTCLVDQLCGIPSYAGSVKIARNPTIESLVCVKTDVAIPEIPRDICLKVTHCNNDPTTLCSCSGLIGKKICNSCSVCSSGRSVSLDCTNVAPFLNATCIGI